MADHLIQTRLDRDRVERLTGALLEVLKAYYEAGPIHRDRVFEVLNALAVTTGITLHGTDEQAFEFFMHALRAHVPLEWDE